MRDSSPAGLAALAAEMDALADGREFPVIDDDAGERMKERILAAQAELDSVGGICECVATGLPVGAGSPLFDSLESQLARVLFGIPAVKGIEFGAGFDAARMRGSTHNDPYEIRGGAVMTKTEVTSLVMGGLFIIRGELTPGELAIFTGLSWAVSNPMRELGNLINDLQRFSTSAAKVMELHYGKPEIVDAPDAMAHERMQGQIEFDHVSFGIDSKPILSDVTFSVLPGQTVAVMGPTGSGKTTLIQLLARFYDVTEGQIRVDGCDVKQWKLKELRGDIGTATQDVFLFSDTVEGNIAFGNQALTLDEVKDFARRADAAEFAEKLPEGYDTIIGERGVGLSGGQRQRIALARALAVRPSILVMDDTTSAVDSETELYIQNQLRSLPFPCTKFIIAQRISSMRDADLILVLQDGKITEQGTHRELLEKRGYYWQTYCLQYGIPMEEAV